MDIKIDTLTPDGFLLSEISRLAKDGISIAVDFDSTLCLTDGYPHIVGVNGKCFKVLHEWQSMGCKILLHTMRQGQDLLDAVVWCEEQGFLFDAVNCNPESDRLYPHAEKMYAVLYVDDKAMGTPLLRDTEGIVRDHVDWNRIDENITPLLTEIISKLNNSNG